MPKMLIDCDAYFASCEIARNPALRGKPVIVAGDTERRSVVTAASYEARKYGVKAGMPIQEARAKAPKAVFVSGNIRLYLDFNLKMFKKLLSYKEAVELYSIDEFYIDHRGSYEEARALVKDFKRWLAEELRITVSAGIAPTKVFAKLASEMEKPDGLTILRAEDIPERVEHIPVKDLFGVGPQTDKLLSRYGIRTIGDLRRTDRRLLWAEMGVRGEWLHDAAMGVNDAIVKVEPDPYKSMGNEMTLPEDTGDPAKQHAFLLYLADIVSQRLRADRSMARTVHLHIRYSDFTDISRSKTMTAPMFLAEHLMTPVNILWEKFYQKGRVVRLLGIGTSNLVRAQGYQCSLFEFEREEKLSSLAETLDDIRGRFGQESIVRASTMIVTHGEKRGSEPFAVVPGTGRRSK